MDRNRWVPGGIEIGEEGSVNLFKNESVSTAFCGKKGGGIKLIKRPTVGNRLREDAGGLW